MSRQPDAKLAQKYNPQPVFPACSNCRYMRTERLYKDWGGWGERHSCSKGEFAIKKLGTCAEHEHKRKEAA